MVEEKRSEGQLPIPPISQLVVETLVRFQSKTTFVNKHGFTEGYGIYQAAEETLNEVRDRCKVDTGTLALHLMTRTALKPTDIDIDIQILADTWDEVLGMVSWIILAHELEMAHPEVAEEDDKREELSKKIGEGLIPFPRRPKKDN